jgi:hypothetical protein
VTAETRLALLQAAFALAQDPQISEEERTQYRKMGEMIWAAAKREGKTNPEMWTEMIQYTLLHGYSSLSVCVCVCVCSEDNRTERESKR